MSCVCVRFIAREWDIYEAFHKFGKAAEAEAEEAQRSCLKNNGHKAQTHSLPPTHNVHTLTLEIPPLPPSKENYGEKQILLRRVVNFEPILSVLCNERIGENVTVYT